MIRTRLAIIFFVPFSGVAAQQSAADTAMASYASLFRASFDTAAMNPARLAAEWKSIAETFAGLRHHRWHAVALLNAANAYRALDDEDSSLETLRALLAELRTMQDTALESNVRFDIASIYRGRRREDLAQRYADPDGGFTRTFGIPPLPIPTRSRSPADSADLLESRLPFDLEGSSVAERAARLSRVEALYERAENHWEQGRILRRMAACHAFVARRDSARVYFGRATSLARLSGDGAGLIAGLLADGRVLEELGDTAGAKEQYQAALVVADAETDIILRSMALARLSGVAGAAGDHDRALRQATTALAPLIDTAGIVSPDANRIDVADGLQVMMDASERAVSPYPDAWRDARDAIVHALRVAVKAYRASGRQERAEQYEAAARLMMPRGAGRRASAGC